MFTLNRMQASTKDGLLFLDHYARSLKAVFENAKMASEGMTPRQNATNPLILKRLVGSVLSNRLYAVQPALGHVRFACPYAALCYYNCANGGGIKSTENDYHVSQYYLKQWLEFALPGLCIFGLPIGERGDMHWFVAKRRFIDSLHLSGVGLPASVVTNAPAYRWLQQEVGRYGVKVTYKDRSLESRHPEEGSMAHALALLVFESFNLYTEFDGSLPCWYGGSSQKALEICFCVMRKMRRDAEYVARARPGGGAGGGRGHRMA